VLPGTNRLIPSSTRTAWCDEDLRLTESSAILKYLADKIGSPTYPQELKQRAKVNEAMDFINTNLHRDFGYAFCYPQLFPHLKLRNDEAQAAALEKGKERSKRWLKVLNDYWIGPNKYYLCGAGEEMAASSDPDRLDAIRRIAHINRGK
jgi:glutathione S-transferase